MNKVSDVLGMMMYRTDVTYLMLVWLVCRHPWGCQIIRFLKCSVHLFRTLTNSTVLLGPDCV